MQSKLLEGDIALITGAASGIGRGIARALAHEGARVVLADVERERGEAAAAALRAEGAEAVFHFADLASEDGPARLCGTAPQTFGPFTILVHSASPRRLESDNVLAVSDAVFDQMLAVNLKAGFVLAREISRTMLEREIRGRILFITSLHAATPRNLPHYSAAKAGQTMIMKEFAKALGPHGIRVNAIAPGAVPGGGFDAASAGLERLIGCTSLRRLGTPEDIGAMAVALLCDRFSAYVTGTTVDVDGGMALHNWIEPTQL
ncbi:MAG TPA: SDR family oxidoreductase [Burkholderiales bacterium]|nr:SDR family oxidoreductase [Burkholderiales bacterium]